jgi:Lipopolysaccharide-assembly
MRALKFFLPLLAAGLLAGCAGYRLGPVNGETAGAKSLELTPFGNMTIQPRLNDAVNEALRERVQHDGTFRLATDGSGDLVLSGSIDQYTHAGLGYMSRSYATAVNYNVAVTAHITVRERATGKIIFSREVKANTLVNVGTDFASSERQAMPALAANLAQNVLAQLAEGSW